MKLETISPFALKANPWNTNKVDRENFDKLKLSVKNLGNFKPVIVRQLEDGSFEIIGGYHRVEVAKELGFPTVPIVNLGELDDSRAKEISLVDNTRYGEDDTELLSKLLDEIDTELLTAIMPDAPETLPDIEDASKAIEEEIERERSEESEFKTLKFKLDIDRAEEIEAVLSITAHDKGFTFPDGYSNWSEALYHLLVVEKR